MCVPFRYASYSQDTFATTNAGSTGAHRLQNHAGLDSLQERIQLRPRAGELDRVALVGHVENASAEDLGQALHFIAILSRGAHLDQHQLALDMVAVSEVDDLTTSTSLFSCLVIC